MTFYYFVNVTKNIDDIAGKTDIKNVGILSLFESVIHANNWDSKDAIMAFPVQSEEYDHPIMRYENGDFEFKFKCDECDSIDEDSCGCNESVDGIVAPNNSEIDEKEQREREEQEEYDICEREQREKEEQEEYDICEGVDYDGLVKYLNENGIDFEEMESVAGRLDNCTYCGDKLRNHAYGNICGKHIPSYALWDDGNDYESDSNYSAFYEELSERKLAIELDEYDCGQDDYDIEDDRYDSRSDIDQGYGYECEGFEESCY